MATLLTLVSCQSFLDEYSQDERTPKTTTDFSEILFGEAYFRGNSLPFQYLELLTDDVTSVAQPSNKNGEDTRQDAYGYYTWQDAPEVSPAGRLNSDQTWAMLYHHILMANTVLANLETMQGTPEEKAQLEGEASAARLFAYFFLTNIYGQPYDPATAERALGVPINDHSYSEDANFPRASVARNYAEMVSCIERGMAAFAKAPAKRTTFRWNSTALAILASRVYLYMQDWDNAIKYADIAISQNPSLYDLNTKTKYNGDGKNAFISRNNREITFQYGFYQSFFLSTSNRYYFTASEDLMGTYGPGDLRFSGKSGEYIRINEKCTGGWFGIPKVCTTIIEAKKNGDDAETGTYGYAIRTAEAYLNRAEAYAQKGDTKRAMADINHLREARVKPANALLPDPATQEELISLVRDERRRELCFEFHRWFDLRRWSRPAIVHSYITSSGEEEVRQEYRLEQNDPKYTLPIPQLVLNSDKVLSTNTLP